MGIFWTLHVAVFRGGRIATDIALATTIGSLGNFISPPIAGYLSIATHWLVAAQYYFVILIP